MKCPIFATAATKAMTKLLLMDAFKIGRLKHEPLGYGKEDIAKAIGFREDQYMPGLQVTKFGNTYSGASPIGLAAVLDKAESDQRILLVGYGSGAGSDAYSLVTTSQIEEKRNRQKFNVQHQVENEHIEYVDYDTYRKLKLGL